MVKWRYKLYSWWSLSPEQWYSMIEDFKVTIWYTAPTALRMLMSAGDNTVEI